MLQTGYKAFTTLAKGLPYNGGFCKWYYADKAQLVTFPAIDPLTQYLNGEPLISGSWYGPVLVPNDQLGYEETPKRDSAGLYWQHKIAGFHPGDSPASRINIENMHYYEFVVIGKLRAGGMYVVIGDNNHGLQFDATYSSDGHKSAGNNFTLTANLLNKAFVLPSFSGTNIILPPGYTPAEPAPLPDDDMREPEMFPFDAVQTQLTIDWNTARKLRFGSFPLIEVWYTEGDTMRLSTSPAIAIDASPPNTTRFTVTINTPGPGVVIIK
jgi:hypothetical protein